MCADLNKGLDTMYLQLQMFGNYSHTFATALAKLTLFLWWISWWALNIKLVVCHSPDMTFNRCLRKNRA